MPPLRPSMDEAVALARVVLEHPDDSPPDASPLLEAAVRVVVRELDAEDRALFGRVVEQPRDSPSREAVEQAIAYRISLAALRLRGRVAGLTDEAARRR